MPNLCKRASLLLLALFMALSCLPVPTLAVEAKQPDETTTETSEQTPAPEEAPFEDSESPAQETSEEPTEPAEEPEIPAEEPTVPAEEPENPAEESTLPIEEPEESEDPVEEPAFPDGEPENPVTEPTAPAEETQPPVLESETEEEETEYLTFSMVNPLYEGQLDPVTPAAITETDEVSDAYTVHNAVCASASSAGTAIRNNMKNRIRSFTVTYTDSQDVTSERLWYIIQNYALNHTGNPKEGDYLMWHWKSYSAEVSSSYSGGTYRITLYITFDYFTNASQEKQVDTYVSNLRKSLNLSGKTDYEKICAVYDWICKNVTYDYEHLNDMSYGLQQTAYGAIVKKTCVCQGYSLLFYRMMLEEGIDARVVAGYGFYVSDSQRHSWNIVEINGRYYNVDSTWDAESGSSSYQYFLRCPANFDDEHIRFNSWNTSYETDLDYTSSSFTSRHPMASSDYRLNLSTPTLRSVENVANGVKLTWSAVSNARKYDVYRKTLGGSWQKINTVSGTSYTNGGVTSGRLYTYTVRAVTGFSQSSYDSTGLTIRHLSAPTVTGISNYGAGVTLTWKRTPGANGYNIYRRTGNGSYTTVGIVRNGNTTSFTDTSVKNNGGKTYTYRVVAYNGSYKSIYRVSPSLVRLSNPTLVGVENVANGVKLTWKGVTGATKYNVYRKTLDSGWVKINTVTGTSYTNSGVTSGRHYTYTVRAVNGSSLSNYNGTGLTIQHLAAPTVTSTSNSHAGINLIWKQTPGASGYNIYRRTGNGSYTTVGVVRGATATRFTDTSVQANGGTTYTYRVVAFCGAYKSIYRVSDSLIRLDTPTIRTLTQASTGVTVHWNTIPGCSGYNIYRASGNSGYTKVGYVRGSGVNTFTDTSARGKRGTFTYKVEAYRGSSKSAGHSKTITLR